MKPKNSILAITLGDPAGIGAEIIVKSLAKIRIKQPIIIIGSQEYFPQPSAIRITAPTQANENVPYFLHLPADPGQGDPSFHYLQSAVDMALRGDVQAIVTAPITKRKWLEAGIPFAGHTEYLATRSGSRQYAMAFWSAQMRLVLYSTHLPLRQVFNVIKKEKIAAFLRFVADELQRLFGRRFNLMVSGLNPHAGENGHLGSEEKEEIIPALETVRQQVALSGPYPPDTVFLQARSKKDAVVIAWYHDQGLIPFKLRHIHSGVNLTLGLPFIRTAPDHGTALDIAGQGKANPASMIRAINLAQSLLQRTR